jgi:hypothetical protein
MSDPTPDDTAGLDAATVREEEAEAAARHDADRPPTEDEARRADEVEPDPAVAEHFEEMNRIGAEAKGEGEIS